MRNLLLSCFSKEDSLYTDYLKLFISEAETYKKELKLDVVLSKKEKEYFNFIIKSYEISKRTPSKDLFERNFIETTGQFDNAKEISPNDLKVYIFNLIDLRVNRYVKIEMEKLSNKIATQGITSEIADEFDRLRSLSNRNKAKNIDIHIDSRKEYDSMKEKPYGLQTGIKEIDDKIGGMNKGTVTTIAGFTSQFKCVSENERILTNKGLLTIKEIYDYATSDTYMGLWVQSEYGMQPLFAVHDEGEKESYKIYIGGIPIESSPVHRFRVLTDKGIQWVQARDLHKGDKVLQTLKRCPLKGEKDIADKYDILGFIYGIGMVSPNRIKTDYVDSIYSMFTKYDNGSNGNNFDVKGYITEIIDKGFYDNGDGTYHIEFPIDIFYKDKRCWQVFINSLMKSKSYDRRGFCFNCVDKEFLYQLSRMLSAIGVSTVLGYRTDKDTNNTIYVLNIQGYKSYDNLIHFAILFRQGEYTDKTLNMDYLKDTDSIVNDYISTVRNHISNNGDNVAVDSFDNECKKAELYYNEITDIKKSKCYMYDLTVKNSPTYVLNGYITHNTTFALNIARYNAYYLGYNIAYISLETPKTDMNWNLLACHSYYYNPQLPKIKKYPFIPHDKMRHCKMSLEEEDYLFNEVEKDLKGDYIGKDGKKHHRGQIVFLDESDFNNFSFAEISTVLEKVDDQLGGKLDAVIVDYIQLCKFSGSGFTLDANSQINSYVTFFRRLSQNFRKYVNPENGKETVKDLTMILLAQINRTSWQKASRNDGRYDVTCLADANELERGSYRVFTTYTTEEMKQRKAAQVQILKNRTGQTMSEPATVYADGESYVFMSDENINNSVGNVDGSATISAVMDGLDDADLAGLGI